MSRHPHIVAAVMIVATAAFLLLLWAWALSGGSGRSASDIEDRFRAYLHSPQGQLACDYYNMGAVLTPEADAELAPERAYVIMEEECR